MKLVFLNARISTRAGMGLVLTAPDSSRDDAWRSSRRVIVGNCSKPTSVLDGVAGGDCRLRASWSTVSWA